jgi:DNA mismatch repair protein PMS1
LKSFGFRGEALNSLCSVSEVEITTKTLEDVAATVAVFDKDGKVVKKSNAAATVGTVVRVRKLFENVPVRRNYYANSKSRKEDDFKKS